MPSVQPEAQALSLLSQIGLDAGSFPARYPVKIIGDAPSFDTNHRIVEAAAVSLLAYAIAVDCLWQESRGRAQKLSIDMLQAAAAIYPVRYQKQNGYPMPLLPGAELAQDFFPTQDGRWFYPVASYPHLRNRTLEILDCANTKAALGRAIAGRKADELEELFAAHKIPAAYVRTKSEWRAHPQGQILAKIPAVQVRQVRESRRAAPAASPSRPLAGIRVLDFSHVIAGPVAARTLAEHGADVLRISAPHQPDPLVQIMDTGIGKRTAFLDIRNAADLDKLKELCRSADVFVDSWRPGVLAKYGLSPEQLSLIQPNLVYLTINSFGPHGPWADRGGFEQIGQLVSGICDTESRGGRPRLVPTHFLNDYLTGYLAAAGVVAALISRLRNGGSFHVAASLTQTSMWVQSLGEVEPGSVTMSPFDIAPALERRASPFGMLEQLPPVVRFSETPARWDLPPHPLGAHLPIWHDSDQMAGKAETCSI
jgi:crotonobetainyl-CoA:carnitine CoA-transferase CaiB-like acyl-CoA transferase